MMKHQKDGTLTQVHLNDPCGNFQRMFGTRQRHAGITEVKRYHELRASYLTAVCEVHGIKVAADAAGIKSLQTAARYDRSSKMATVAKASQVVSNSYMSNVP